MLTSPTSFALMLARSVSNMLSVKGLVVTQKDSFSNAVSQANVGQALFSTHILSIAKKHKRLSQLLKNCDSRVAPFYLKSTRETGKNTN